ncbi:MAG: alpha/beta fold hydrolase [Actinomycetota bacterium]
MSQLRSITIGQRTTTYRAAGEQGPVLLLIHGLASSSHTWEPVIDELGRTHCVIAPDLPGAGGSNNPGGDFSLGSQASCVRDLMVALDIDTATFVGHSFGGGVAMQSVYQFPERCERLVLVSSGGLGREVAGLLRALSLPGAELGLAVGCAPQIVNAGYAIQRALRRVGLQPTPSTRAVGRSYASLATGEARTTLLRSLRAVVGVDGQRVSAHDRLHLAALVPTMIVWGTRDRMIPVTHAYSAKDAIPGSRLELLEGAGHFPHHDQAGRFVEALNDFISETEPAALTGNELRSLLDPVADG